MNWEICVIDDSIPVTGEIDVDDTVGLNISTLNLLLEKNEWTEEPVKNLVEDLSSDSANWNVLAFRQPNIYLQYSKKYNYRPDMIIFDWEYAGFTDDITQKLLEVVQNSFSLVYVYTHVDTEGKVTEEISKSIFNDFSGKRLFLISKGSENSPKRLLEDAQRAYGNNFAFRFGRTLRLSTGEAIEDILVRLGKGNMDFVLALLNDEATQETDIKQFVSQQVGAFLSGNGDLLEELKTKGLVEDKNAQALIELIRGRIESHISSLNFEFPEVEGQTEGGDSFSKEFWSNRLYYKPSDNIVRKADIVFCSEDQQYYLVISADCDLNRLWSKNFGYINMVPAFNMSTAKDEIIGLLTITKDQDKAQEVFTNFHQGSVTGLMNQMVEGPIVLPFLGHQGNHQYLMLFPKGIKSFQVIPTGFQELEANIRKNKAITYDEWDNFERVSTIFEPFASAIIQHCLKSISGYGTPDYPKIIKSLMKADIAGFINEQADQEAV